METLETEEGESSRDNLSVSHVGLIDSLRPLVGTRTTIRTQAQGDIDCPKKNNRKVFKDVTNKLEVRPTIAKPSRPITKGNGAQQVTEIRILKRPREVWRNEELNGPPSKSPFDLSNVGQKTQGKGLGQDHPLDSPDINRNLEGDRALASLGKEQIWGRMSGSLRQPFRHPREEKWRWRKSLSAGKRLRKSDHPNFDYTSTRQHLLLELPRGKEREFLREMKEFNRMHKSVIITLIELRISGEMADSVCKKLGKILMGSIGFGGI